MKPETDDYPTCSESYVTLRMYHREASPDAATAALGLEPTSTQKVGDTYESSNTVRTKKVNGWFYCSESSVASFDLTKHFTHVLDRLDGKEEALRALIEQGWRADFACMWDSAFGHGGPALEPELLSRLARFGIEVWFDVYFHGTYELLKKEKEAFGGR